jgi:CcmD family protein
MNSIGYLYAAYIATWSIQGLYLGSVVRRYIRLQRRMKNSGNDVGR